MSVVKYRNSLTDEWQDLAIIKGDQGPAGYTPVRGIDYWTEEDQRAIIEAVLAQVSTATYSDGEGTRGE